MPTDPADAPDDATRGPSAAERAKAAADRIVFDPETLDRNYAEGINHIEQQIRDAERAAAEAAEARLLRAITKDSVYQSALAAVAHELGLAEERECTLPVPDGEARPMVPWFPSTLAEANVERNIRLVIDHFHLDESFRNVLLDLLRRDGGE